MLLNADQHCVCACLCVCVPVCVCKTGYIILCCMQVSLSLLIRRASRMSPAVKLIVQKFVPFPAVGQLAHIFYCISYFNVRNTQVHE